MRKLSVTKQSMKTKSFNVNNQSKMQKKKKKKQKKKNRKNPKDLIHIIQNTKRNRYKRTNKHLYSKPL